MATRLAHLLLLCGALTIPAGVAACGSDASSSDASVPAESAGDTTLAEEEAEEYEIVPDSEVTAGLAELEEMGAAAVAATGAGSGSVDDVDAMYEKWAAFEGTIKQNKVDLYLTMEDSMASLRSAVEEGDRASATEAMAALSEASAAYLEEHP